MLHKKIDAKSRFRSTLDHDDTQLAKLDCNYLIYMVGDSGIEPLTPAV
jgi:hypothetical protein